jgi:hypothetical protein
MRTEAADSSKTLVGIYQMARRHISEDRDHNSQLVSRRAQVVNWRVAYSNNGKSRAW